MRILLRHGESGPSLEKLKGTRIPAAIRDVMTAEVQEMKVKAEERFAAPEESKEPGDKPEQAPGKGSR